MWGYWPPPEQLFVPNPSSPTCKSGYHSAPSKKQDLFLKPPTNPFMSPPSFPRGQTPSSPACHPGRHPCLPCTSQRRGVGWIVVVIVGECCDASTGCRVPPRLELTLFAHHALCHNLTQCNATRRTTTPHSTMQHRPPWRSTIRATQHGATQPDPAHGTPTQQLPSQFSPKPLFPWGEAAHPIHTPPRETSRPVLPLVGKGSHGAEFGFTRMPRTSTQRGCSGWSTVWVWGV